MSFLAGIEAAVVEQNKIVAYLLNAEHPEGGPKARFFLGHGARPEAWAVFWAVLLEHARTNPLANVRTSPYGSLYQIDCFVTLPDGASCCIRTVWEIRIGQSCPRLVTAHPN